MMVSTIGLCPEFARVTLDRMLVAAAVLASAASSASLTVGANAPSTTRSDLRRTLPAVAIVVTAEALTPAAEATALLMLVSTDGV